MVFAVLDVKRSRDERDCAPSFSRFSFRVVQRPTSPMLFLQCTHFFYKEVFCKEGSTQVGKNFGNF